MTTIEQFVAIYFQAIQVLSKRLEQTEAKLIDLREERDNIELNYINQQKIETKNKFGIMQGSYAQISVSQVRGIEELMKQKLQLWIEVEGVTEKQLVSKSTDLNLNFLL